MRVRSHLRCLFAALSVAAGTAFLAAVPPEPAEAPLVLTADVDAIIHPVSAEYMVATIDRADAAGAALVVFTLRTPGGLVDSTRTIITRMITAKTPVVVFIAPSGARAASAGFLLTIAADVAAMAPGTAVGAAHPVSGDGQPVDQTVAKKAASDVAAYARSLATQRKRNVSLAEQAVLESRAFTDGEALKADPPLIDLTARDLADLLAQLEGRTITRFDGSQATLHTANARLEHVQMTWRQRVLSAVAHPQVAYLLFTLGTLGLTIELWNPGSVLPGVVGGLALLLAFFAFQILPVNYAGLALILFGLLLLVLEVKVASFGLLAIGGLVSLVFGSLMLFDAPVPELRLALGFVLPLMFGFAAVVLFLVKLAVDAQRRRASTGQAGMIAERGRALTAIPAGGTGRVATHGEIWSATSHEAIAVDEQVEVLAVDGLTLRVKRVAPAEGGGLP
jgi:membrane-bound serine protease (ClpP class)